VADLSAIYAADFAVIDDLITVTLTPQSTGTAQAVAYTLKLSETRRDGPDDPAIFEEIDTVFHVWASNLAGTAPLKGDRVTLASGASYRVTQVDTLDHGSRYRLHTLREWTP
jgi:hypothetical protein